MVLCSSTKGYRRPLNLNQAPCLKLRAKNYCRTIVEICNDGADFVREFSLGKA